MKISGYAMAMQTRHEQSQQSSVKETLRIWVDRPASAQTPSQQVSISPAAQEKHASEATAMDDAARNAHNDPKLQLLIF